MTRGVQHLPQFQPRTWKPAVRVIALDRRNHTSNVIDIVWFHKRLSATIIARVTKKINKKQL